MAMQLDRDVDFPIKFFSNTAKTAKAISYIGVSASSRSTCTKLADCCLLGYGFGQCDKQRVSFSSAYQNAD